jgi:glycerol kinase
MEKDSGHALSELAVDGGMSNSDLAMQVQTCALSFSVLEANISHQIQSDLISIPVYRPKMRETTALGAAIAAGLAVGVWRNFAELRDINRAGGAVFEPKISREESAKSFARWEKAVAMCKGWSGDEPPPPVQLQPAQKEIKKNAPEVVTNHNAVNATPVKLNGELITPKFPLISISGDLDDADEEDLYLELRKIEILQRLKKLRKLKLSFY